MKLRRILNGAIAITIGYSPIIVPEEHIILGMVILGQIFVAIIVYTLLELVNQ